MIKFVAEYTSGPYNYLVLYTGVNPYEACIKSGCCNASDCTVYDPEGDSMAYCVEHAMALDADPDWEDTRRTEGSPDDIMIEWIKANRGRFVKSYDPEQSYNF